MKLTTTTVELPGAMAGYYAYRENATERLPGVIVIQEIWGVDAHMRDVTERLAAAGYAAIAPDLFSRGGGRPPELGETRMEAVKNFLDDLAPSRWMNLMDPSKRGGELARAPEAQRASLEETIARLFAPDRMSQLPSYVQNLVAIAGWLRAQPQVDNRKIGAIGFCMGGGLAGMLAATDPQLGAAAIYYGMPPAKDAVANIACPVLFVVGKDDERLVAMVPAFEDAMKQAGKSLELATYAGAPHAFFNDTRSSYRAAASRDAWARTLALFARALD